MTQKRPRAVVFYTYLPPWRIDVFNEMSKQYDLTIVFLDGEAKGFTYNRELLLSKLNANAIFLDKGVTLLGKPLRFGVFGILRKINPHVVFTHEYFPTSILLAIYLSLKIFRFKLVVTTSDNLSIAKNVSFVKALFRKYILKVSTGIVVYSEDVKNWYRERFPNLTVEVCPNIQNPYSLLRHLSQFPRLIAEYKERYELNDKVILYIGRLEYVKGLDLLIKAFAKFGRSDYKLVLVGEGSEKDNLKDLAQAERVADKIVFPGYFDEYRLYAWYTLANFFVLPSRFEPFGAVVNEALVFGCPVLASKNIGALDYIQNGINGYVFDPEDESSFVSNLKNCEDLSELIITGSSERQNLMPLSFKDYISAFVKVVN